MRVLAALFLLIAGAAMATPAMAPYPVVRPGVTLRFPADHGAHPAFRTEWWYVTGWLRTASGRDLGFQVTFFRSRPRADAANPSRFAPRQLLFAHAALSDPQVRRVLHDDRAARAGFGLASAAIGDADVRIRDWRLRRLSDGRFAARVEAEGFAYDLVLRPTQPPIAQGEGGFSRKGPLPEQASYYYSVPHMAVSGSVSRAGKTERVTGTAWLDREWSSDFLSPLAQGWDWAGINLDDGGALTVFRIRRRDGGTLWAGGSLRRADGRIVRFAPDQVRFRPLRRWTSPSTRATYPVSQEISVRLPEGVRRYRLDPLFPAQELDVRASGLPVYWEGAVRTTGGRGYLEMTGYAGAIAL